MSLPIFYIEQFDEKASLITLNEETSKHVVQVLRMQAGEQIHLTDGRGYLLTAQIAEAHKRNCVVKVQGIIYQEKGKGKTTIAISLVKNASRFEWFLEKATELGVNEIVPLLCERTERQHFRYERMKGILLSAMLQSKQVWLPVLSEPVKFEEYVRQTTSLEKMVKLIAHCEDAEKQQLSNLQIAEFSNSIILIGPEGDFTPKEIELALQQHFLPVALGETRLRTETAGIAAAVLLSVR